MSETRRPNRSRVVGPVIVVLLAAAAWWFLRSRDDGPGPTALSNPTAASAESTPSPTSTELAAAPHPLGAASAPSATPPTPTPPTTERTVEIVERVIGPDDAPIGGAEAEARYEGAVVARATSDAEGKVTLRVERPEGATGFGPVVITRATGGLAAVRGTGWTAGPLSGDAKPLSRIDLKDVKLVPANSLSVRVTGPGRAPVAADVTLYLEYSIQQSVATSTTGVDGIARFDVVASGTYLVVAAGPTGRGVGWALVSSRASAPTEIVLAPLRDVDVTVVDEVSRAPIPAATLTLLEQVRRPDASMELPYRPTPTIAPTDARGRTTVRGLAVEARISVLANAPGYPQTPTSGFARRSNGTALPPAATTLEVTIVPGRRVTWVVEAGDAPVPPDGTTLTLGQSVGSGTSPPSMAGRMEGGMIVIDGVGGEPVHWLAIAPDGSRAALFALPGKTEGTPTKFVAPRAVDISLHWADGSPAEGIHVALRNQGNNPMGAPVVIDANGAARIEGLEAQMAEAYASSAGAVLFGGRRIGTANLAKGSARIEATLTPRRAGTIRVFLDGVPGVPAGIASGLSMEAEVTITRQDAKAGALEVMMWPLQPDGRMTIPFQAPGWLASAGVTIPAGTGAFDARLDLARAGSLDVTVVRATEVRSRLRLELFDPAKGEWTGTRYATQTYGAGQAQLEVDGHWRLKTIAAGRYRVRDTVSSTLSDEVTVTAGTEPATLTLDLSRVGYAQGRVIVPEGESTEAVMVHVTPAPPPSSLGEPAGIRCSPDGSFRILVPGDREVDITADHPTLAPARLGGVARASTGAKGLEIRLVKGPTCRIRLDREPTPARTYGGRPGAIQVHVWKGPMRGEPTSSTEGTVDGASIVIGRLPPGRVSLFLDPGTEAPLVLENVEIGEGETVLGPVTLSKGSGLVFEVIPSPGHDLPRMSAYADRIDAKPVYLRWGDIGATGRLDGLGRGRFRVRVSAAMGGTALYEKEFEVDGTTDVPIRVELK